MLRRYGTLLLVSLAALATPFTLANEDASIFEPLRSIEEQQQLPREDRPHAFPLRSPPLSDCQWSSYDFTSLSVHPFTAFNSTTGESFSLQMCRGLVWDPPQPQETERACTWLTTFHSVCYVPSQQVEMPYGVGAWATAQYALIDPTQPKLGVRLSLVGENSCAIGGAPTQRWHTAVELLCSEETGPLSVVRNDTNPCVTTLQLPTPTACPLNRMLA